MIFIRVELWPHGKRELARDLGTATIANDGQGDAANGNYCIKLMKWDGKGVWRQGRVYKFPRLRLGPWDLLLRCLHALIAPRNPEVPQEFVSVGEIEAVEADEGFNGLVERMRASQKEYFKTRSDGALERSKALEKEVDAALAGAVVEPKKVEADLFGEVATGGSKPGHAN